MAAPSPEVVARIEADLQQIVTSNGKRILPFAALPMEDRSHLVELWVERPGEAESVVDRLVNFMASQNLPVRKLGHEALKKQADLVRKRVNQALSGVYDSSRGNSRRKQKQQREAARATFAALPEAQRLVGMPSVLLQAIGHLLLDFPDKIWWDDFYKSVMVKELPFPGSDPAPHLFDDFDRRNLQAHLSQYGNAGDEIMDPNDARALPCLGNIRPTSVVDAAVQVAQRDIRNEPRDWLQGLRWDGRLRLCALFPVGFGAEASLYAQEAGRCFMVSMVARIYVPGCKVDTMPVLRAGEGARKGQALKLIGGKYYRAATATMDQKDFLQNLIGCVLMELAEMHSLSGRGNDTQKNKFVITNNTDNFRLPYDKLNRDHLRTVVFAGTTNLAQWFEDVGPGRRFDPITCGEIDLDWIAANREQLWAEAVAYWRLGAEDPRGCWWNQPAAEHEEEIAEVRQEGKYEGALSRFLRSNAVYYDGVSDVPPICSRLIINGSEQGPQRQLIFGTLLEPDRLAIEALGFDLEKTGRQFNFRDIGASMRALGFVSHQYRVRGQGYTVRFWVRQKITGLNITEADVGQPDAGTTQNNGQFPF